MIVNDLNKLIFPKEASLTRPVKLEWKMARYSKLIYPEDIIQFWKETSNMVQFNKITFHSV